MSMIVMAAAESGGSSAVTQFLIAALGVGGLGAIIGAIVTGLFSKKKLGAEATEIITKAAAGVVTNLESQIDRQNNRHAEDRAEWAADRDKLISEHRAELEEVRRVLQLHVAWDAIAIAKMAEFGVDLPPAPPLLPPGRIDGLHGS